MTPPQHTSVHIGTSGWSYKHWKGTFYPKGIKVADEFQYYSSIFSTVEINNTFYRLPAKSVFEKWRDAVADEFLFAVKGSRFITHMKKFKDPKESFQKFFDHVSVLGSKLGPVLFQLPPRWRVNTDRLHTFLQMLPKYMRFAFEFREPSWYHEEVLSLLRRFNCAFCIYELDGHHSPRSITADFTYIRLHGPGGKYEGSYDKRALKTWAQNIMLWADDGLDVFVYFDNDQHGYAAHNARDLQEICRGISHSNSIAFH
jgi:uncharacterized protein YecE (DUF72 family)